MDETFIKILGTLLIAVFGWLIGHFLTSNRDLRNKERESVVDFITETYKSISNYLSNPEKENGDLELIDALIKIQCFGDEKQVEMAKTSLKSIGSGYVSGLGDLLTSLRDRYRKELNLPPIQENVAVVRRSKNHNNGNQN